MSNTEVETLARELLSAYETGQMVPVPLSRRPGFDLNTAYEVEATLKQIREAGGHRAVGRKVGYANKAMWRVLKLETLVWAHMYDDTVHYVDSNSTTLTLAHPRSLKIEPEIVFGLKQPIMVEDGEGPDATAALAANNRFRHRRATSKCSGKLLAIRRFSGHHIREVPTKRTHTPGNAWLLFFSRTGKS